MKRLREHIWGSNISFKNVIPYLLLIISIFTLWGCGDRTVVTPYSGEPSTQNKSSKAENIERTKYSVQVGAFSNSLNASRYTDKLNEQGIDAYFFLDDSGLYKVRIGDFKTYDTAVDYAKRLKSRKAIEEFFIVRPEDYDYNFRPEDRDHINIRKNIVKTAKKYIGVPYRWGGETAAGGFDCSGLTMVVYKLNGLNLPRHSGWQFEQGKAISKSQLKEGDLVFFATSGGKRISHVGLYIGGGKFIHAPGKGKHVTIANLNDAYFRRTYVGSKTYIY